MVQSGAVETGSDSPTRNLWVQHCLTCSVLTCSTATGVLFLTIVGVNSLINGSRPGWETKQLRCGGELSLLESHGQLLVIG